MLQRFKIAGKNPIGLYAGPKLGSPHIESTLRSLLLKKTLNPVVIQEILFGSNYS